MRAPLAVITLLLALPALAQEPDSTDWHRYAPLAVGNEWQYRVLTEFFPHTSVSYTVAVVLGTKEVDGQTYFEVLECFRAEDDPTPCSTSEPRTLVRYDEETASVAERVEAGGTVVHRPWGYYPCGLDAPFGMDVTTTCPDGTQQVWSFVTGEPFQPRTSADHSLRGGGMIKTYGTLVSGVVVETDRGMTAYGSGDPGCTTCVELIYSRIDGVENGTPVITVGREDVAPPERSALAVSPNPLRDVATLRFGLDAPARLTLEVYDVRGRLVRTVALGAREAGAHALRFEAGGLPPGAYRLRLLGDGGFEATRGVIVLR
jgi:hypothetical protein